MAALFITTISVGAELLVLVYIRDRWKSSNAIQSYLTSTMSMATNIWLILESSAYLLWTGFALWQMRRLDRDYAENWRLYAKTPKRG